MTHARSMLAGVTGDWRRVGDSTVSRGMHYFEADSGKPIKDETCKLNFGSCA